MKRNITIKTNMKTIDFLDVTLDLRTNTFKPFNKPNNTPLYINVKSNHPPSLRRNIPLAIEKRISKNSSNKEIFDAAAPIYQKALIDSGYTHKDPSANVNNAKNKKKRQRKRNTTWFNPPYAKNTRLNLGTEFKKIIFKHFPKGHILHKIFNENTLKLSYKCMPSMKKIISAHNSKILREEQQVQQLKEKEQEQQQPDQQEVQAPKKTG